MNLIEFIFGITITIVGVVTVEVIIQWMRDNREASRILNSLIIEVNQNLEISQQNKKNKNQGTTVRQRNDFTLFETTAYEQFKLSVSTKLQKVIGDKATNHLLKGYQDCLKFNREFENQSSNLRTVAGKSLVAYLIISTNFLN